MKIKFTAQNSNGEITIKGFNSYYVAIPVSPSQGYYFVDLSMECGRFRIQVNSIEKAEEIKAQLIDAIDNMKDIEIDGILNIAL